MRTLAIVAVVVVLAGCPTPEPETPDDTPPTISAAIYRSGDDRLPAVARSVYRADGNVIGIEAAEIDEPVALITSRREVDLPVGKTALALPEIPGTAEPGSIWLRSVSGPGALEVSQIRRPPSFADRTSLRGRAVVAVDGRSRIAGTLVDLDEKGALIDRDGTLVAVGQARLELAGPGVDPGEPIAADVVAARGGRYLIELAYRTTALDWKLDLNIAVTGTAELGRVAVAIEPMVAIESRGVSLEGGVVALFEGQLNDEGQTPRSIWRGRLDVSPGETRKPLATREVDGAIEYRYRGFLGDRPQGRDHLRWGTGAAELVDLVLRLPPGSLPPAAAIAQVEIAAGDVRRSHRVGLSGSVVEGEPIDVVLGTAATLRGSRRQLWVKVTDGGRQVSESYQLGVINLGDRPARVRVSEPLLRGREVEITRQPDGAKIVGRALEHVLDVPAGERRVFRYDARYRIRR